MVVNLWGIVGYTYRNIRLKLLLRKAKMKYGTQRKRLQEKLEKNHEYRREALEERRAAVKEILGQSSSSSESEDEKFGAVEQKEVVPDHIYFGGQ